MAKVGIEATAIQAGFSHNLDIKETGNKTKVKDDCRNKLMYYLHCFSCISKFCEVHPQWEKYTNYKEYRNWTVEEEEELLYICSDVITLDVAKSVGFIEVHDNLLKNTSNEFYEVTDANEVVFNRVHVHIDENWVYTSKILAGARNKTKFKVMMYIYGWIKKHYYDPLKELRNLIERHRRTIHNREIIKKNKHCCCLISRREECEHPNKVKFLLVLYFILAFASLFFYLHGKIKSDTFDLVFMILYVVGGIIGVILVFISCCYDKWKNYIQLLSVWMIFFSLFPGYVGYEMFSFSIMPIILILISIVSVCLSCELYKLTTETIKPTCLCLCSGVKRVYPERIDYYL